MAKAEPMISVTLAKSEQNFKVAGIPSPVRAYLMGIPDSSLRAAYAGRFKLGSMLESNLLTLSFRCLEFVEALGPMSFKDWSALKKLLEEGRSAADVRAWREQMFPDAKEEVSANER